MADADMRAWSGVTIEEPALQSARDSSRRPAHGRSPRAAEAATPVHQHGRPSSAQATAGPTRPGFAARAATGSKHARRPASAALHRERCPGGNRTRRTPALGMALRPAATPKLLGHQRCAWIDTEPTCSAPALGSAAAVDSPSSLADRTTGSGTTFVRTALEQEAKIAAVVLNGEGVEDVAAGMRENHLAALVDRTQQQPAHVAVSVPATAQRTMAWHAASREDERARLAHSASQGPSATLLRAAEVRRLDHSKEDVSQGLAHVYFAGTLRKPAVQSRRQSRLHRVDTKLFKAGGLVGASTALQHSTLRAKGKLIQALCATSEPQALRPGSASSTAVEYAGPGAIQVRQREWARSLPRPSQSDSSSFSGRAAPGAGAAGLRLMPYLNTPSLPDTARIATVQQLEHSRAVARKRELREIFRKSAIHV